MQVPVGEVQSVDAVTANVVVYVNIKRLHLNYGING